MAATTYNATLAQDGVLASSLWTDGSGIAVEETLGQVAGFRFTGLPTASDFLLSGASLALRLPSVGASQVPLRLYIYARNDPSPDAFSTSNPPPLEREIGPLTDSLIANTTISTAGAQTATIDLLLPALNTARHYGGSAFTGFAFHVHARTADGTALVIDEAEIGTDAVLNVTTDTRTFTGMEIPWGELAVSVPDACPICGEVTLRQTWVWCGLHRRMECPKCADPEDRREATPSHPFPFVGGRGSSPNA